MKEPRFGMAADAQRQWAQQGERVDRMVAVGKVTPHSARIWMRLPDRQPLRLEVRGGSDTRHVGPWLPRLIDGRTCAMTYPDDFPGEAELMPLTRYRFRVTATDGAIIGQGAFKTPSDAPERAPERWSLAFMSCHQPFGKDGAPTQGALDMLTATERYLDQRDVDLVLFLGDQVYADEPDCLSLFCAKKPDDHILKLNPDQMRARYHELYERAWAFPAWQRIQAGRASACVPDDHEIVDNWGTEEKHAQPEWQAVGQAALEAAFVWQGLRSFPVRPRRHSFQQSFRWNNAGFFLLDLRSQRQDGGDPASSQIVDEEQLAALDEFLRNSDDLAVLFFGISVPLIHVPEWLTTIGHALPFTPGDLIDRWSNPVWVKTRNELLKRFKEHRKTHPHQRLVALSGDIHAGWATALQCDEDGREAEAAKDGADQTRRDAAQAPLLQLVSSAITNGDSGLVGTLSEAMLRVSKVLAGKVEGMSIVHLPGVEGHEHNPFGGLNIGIVDVERTGGDVKIRFSLVSHGQGEDDSTQPRVVFDSGLV